MPKIEDFGEKIGGAKKDLFGAKGTIDFSNIESWKPQERTAFIRKDNLFPKPNYQKMYESGIPKEVCWFVKNVWNSLPASPKLYTDARYDYLEAKIHKAEKRIKIGGTIGEEAKKEVSELTVQINEIGRELTLQRQQEYIQQISLMRDLCMDLQTTDDCLLMEDRAERAGLSYSVYSQGMNEKTRAAVHLVPASLTLIDYHQAYSQHYWQCMINRMEDEQFLMSEAEKQADRDFLFARYDGNNVSGTTERGLLVVFEERTFRDVEHECYTDEKKPEYDIQNYQIGKFFAFDRKTHEMAGINFDTLEEAKECAVRAIESRQTLTVKTQKPSKEKLKPVYLESIQRIGEDYRQGTEISGTDMLEVFKLRGGEFGNYENQQERQTNLNFCYDAFQDLAKVLSVKSEDISLGGQLSIAFGSRGSGNALAHYEAMANVINLTKMKGAGSLCHEWGHALDAYLAKEMQTGTKFATSEKAKQSPFAEVVHAMERNPDGSKTKFLSDAEWLGNKFSNSGNQSKCYWNSRTEMFARAFACYVQDKLKEKGEQNDYLCGHAERTAEKINGSIRYAYPVGEERKRINQAIDNMVECLKEQGLLHHQEWTEERELTSLTIDSSGNQEEHAVQKEDNAEVLAEFDRLMDMVSECFPDLEYYPDFDRCESIDEVPDYVEEAVLNALNQQKGTEYYLQYGFEGNAVMKGFDKFVAYTDDFQIMLSELKEDLQKEERKIIRQQRAEQRKAASREM